MTEQAPPIPAGALQVILTERAGHRLIASLRELIAIYAVLGIQRDVAFFHSLIKATEEGMAQIEQPGAPERQELPQQLPDAPALEAVDGPEQPDVTQLNGGGEALLHAVQELISQHEQEHGPLDSEALTDLLKRSESQGLGDEQ